MTSVATVGLMEAAPAGRSRAEQARRAYVAARRHTRLVRFLRKAIPIGAVISFIILIVAPFANPFRQAGVSIGAVRMDGTRVTMESPRLSGHRRDNRPFEVTAAAATQDIRRPTIIEMEEMTANMVSSDNRKLRLTASRATYDTQREQLQLRQGVRIRTEGGQEADMTSADVDFKAGTVRSREPVEVRLQDMQVRAEALDIADSGAIITFSGRVTAIIDERGGGPPTAGATEPAAAPQAQSPQSQTPINPAVLPAPAAAPTAPPVAPAAPPPRDARGVTQIDPVTGRALAPGPAR